jgi:5-methylcytosine-specific restriction enzyme B
MEKIFVHPECPFSEKTFNLLAEFEENRTSDFYLTHQKDFLKYVGKPFRYILSQVEDQLPDFIKKYIKHEQFRYNIFTGYSVDFYFEVEYIHCIDDALLRLNLHNDQLTFSFSADKKYFDLILESYQNNYRNNVKAVEILKRFHLSNKHHVDNLSQEHIIFFNNQWNDDCEKDKLPKSIYELLEHIIFVDRTLPDIIDEKRHFDGIEVGVSLKSEELLGYSDKQLIHKIAQTFKKVFPLFLISNDSPLLIRQYLSVYEKEFNPVYEIEEISEITGFETTQLTQWIHTINRKGQTIIQGPPGTGKTFIAERLAKHLIGGGDGFSEIIQFHPAYTYEDFIEGLRPQNENGQLTYSIIPGRFLQFCEKAEVCEDTCVLIIDEINRANLSQVFGELMYLLDDREDRKRFITLASGKRFRIPTNVRIIGTMNTADRSIALVDNALRRRFAFIPLYPNYELLRNYHEETEAFDVDELISILKNVNQAINNKHYELGISFFLTKTLADDIQDIWQMEIEPYLEEYFFDNQEKMEAFRWNKIKDEFSS